MIEQLGLDFILKIVDENFSEVLKNASKLVDDLDNKTGNNIKKTGDNISSFGKKASLGLTTPILAAGGAILKIGSDFNEISTAYQASNGATEEAVKEHVKRVKNIYTEGIGETVDEVSSVLSNLETQLSGLNVSNDELEDITSQMIQFSKVTDSDVNESIRGLKAIMTSFGVDAQTAMDYLVKGTQNGLNYTDELGDNLAEYAPLFKQNGYSIEEMFNTLQTGVDSGSYNLDRMNDIIKEFGLRVSGGDVQGAVEELGGTWKELYDTWESSGGSQSELMQKLAQQLATVTDETEKSAIISAIWGTQGEDAGAKVIEALGNVENKYNDVGGTSKKMLEDSMTFGQRLQSIYRELSVALEPLGKALIELIEDNLPAIKEFVSNFTKFIESLSPEQIKGILVIAGALALLGPVAMVLGNIVSIFGSVITLASGLGTAFAFIGTTIAGLGSSIVSLGATFLAAIGGPITLIVIAVGVLIAGLAYLIYKNFDDIANFFIGLWENISTFFTDLGNSLSEAFNNVVNSVMQALSDVANFFLNIGQSISNAFNAIVEVCKNSMEFVANIIGSVFNYVHDIVTNVLNTLRNAISAYFEYIKTTFSVIGSLLNSVADIYKTVFNAMSNVGGNLIEGLKEGIINGLTSLYNIITDIANKIIDTFKTIFNIHSPSRVMRDMIGKNLMLGIGEGIEENTGEVLDPIDDLSNEMLDGFSLFDDNMDYSFNKYSEGTEQFIDNTEMKDSKTALNISFRLGRNEYRRFVQDISEEQDEIMNNELIFGGE